MRTRGESCRGGLVAAAVLLVAFALVMLLRPLPPGLGQPLAYAVQVVTAAALCTVMVRRGLTGEPALQRARLLIAAAVACGALGGALALSVQLATGAPPPAPSLSEVVHFAFLPLAVLGLLAYPTIDSEAGSVPRSLLDGLVASLALWFLAYALLLEPAEVGQGLSLPASLVALAYPTADVFVLGTLAGVLPRIAPIARRELSLAGAGFGLYGASDIAFSVVGPTGDYRADSWISVLAEAGLLVMLLGACSRAAPSRLSVRRLAVLPQLPVVLVLVVTAGHGMRGGTLGGPLLAVALAMTLALLARQVIGNRDRRELTQRLQAREELFRSLVNGGSDLITLTDPAGVVVWASPAVSRTVGRPAVEGESLLDAIHADDRPGIAAAVRGARADPDGRAEAMGRLSSVTGWRWMQLRFEDRQDDPAVGGLITNARDVHERHLLEQQLSHAAHHDPLTGLGNLARARQLLARCWEGPATAAVLLVDLDGFKAVNDTFGHARGDALLGEAARRFEGCLRGGDEVVRLGGDEFVMVLADARSAEAVARRVLASLREPLMVSGTLLSTRASIGLAEAVDAGTPDELLRNADLAMYASKAAGRDRVTAYEPSMHSRAARRLQVHHSLRRALDQDLLALHYQPIVRLDDGTLVGAEALLRWDDPVTGEVDTADVISVAEESGIIADVDVWVLERACRDIAAWTADDLVVPRVSINVSRRHMTAELPGLVERALERHGLDGSRLCLEVTESAVVADADVASASLARVRALGVTVALDDFGSGQSSLSQLARLPVDTVKVDCEFTQSARHDPGARRLLASIVHVCRSLDLPVVAEGIEDTELAVLLEAAGCQLGQGWHYGRPLSGPRFAGALARVQDLERAGGPLRSARVPVPAQDA